RFVQYLETAAGHTRFNDPSVDSAGFLGIPAELIDGEAPLALRLRERFACLAGDHPYRVALAANHLVGDGMQGIRTLKCALRLPGYEPTSSPFQRLLGVGNARDGRLSERLFSHGAHHRCSATIRGGTPRAVDE